MVVKGPSLTIGIKILNEVIVAMRSERSSVCRDFAAQLTRLVFLFFTVGLTPTATSQCG